MHKSRMVSTRIRIICLLILLSLTACEKVESIFSANAALPRSTPEEQGMDSVNLLKMLDYIDSGQFNFHSLLVIRHGTLVLEVYYPPFDSQDKHMQFSATKSFVSSLVGIAIAEGFIQNADQPVLDYFSESTIKNMDDAKQNIHLHDLLNMTSGLESDDGQMGESQDWSAFTLNQPLVDEPGRTFDYNSGNSHLLSAIIQKTAKITTFEYAQAKLFKPLGIKDVFWAADPSGVTQGGVGLMLTPQDMAKFGLLYLNQGMWEGNQIVPQAWIQASTEKNLDGYAYQWWQGLKGYAAIGYGGQMIYVIPAKDLVVVATAALPDELMLIPVSLAETYVSKAVKSDQPLPQSPATQELADRLEAIKNPNAKTVPELPEMASLVNGKTIRLDENPLGWKTAELGFEGEQASLTVTSSPFPKERKFMVGLDGRFRQTEQKRVEILGIPEPEQRNIYNPYEFNFLLGMPSDGPVAMKGEWTGDDEFTLTVQDTRDYDREDLVIQFAPPVVTIVWRSTMDGQILTLTGVLE